MSENSSEWSTTASENNDLPLLPMVIDGETVMLSRKESNDQYAYWATRREEDEAARNDPKNYPLNNIQFHAMIDYLEIDAAIRSVIGSMPKGLERSMALKRYESSVSYDRDDPLVAVIAANPAISLTDAEIDTAWMQAKDL